MCLDSLSLDTCCISVVCTCSHFDFNFQFGVEHNMLNYYNKFSEVATLHCCHISNRVHCTVDQQPFSSAYSRKKKCLDAQLKLPSLPFSLPCLLHCRIQSPQLEGRQPSPPLSSFSLPLSLRFRFPSSPLELGTLNTVRGSGDRCKLSVWSEAEPQWKSSFNVTF